MKRTVLLLALLPRVSAASNLNAPVEDRTVSHEEPVVVMSVQNVSALALVYSAVAAFPVLHDRPLYMGSPNRIAGIESQLIHAKPKGHYAAVLSPDPQRYQERVMTPFELNRLTPLYSGPIPDRLSARPKADQRAWGLELGRRMRDQLRNALHSGILLDTWQFDEIPPAASQELSAHGVAMRVIMANVLHGLAFGRPELADKPWRGIVFVSHPRDFGRLPPYRADAILLMQELEKAAFAIAGEEFPSLNGDPRQAARRQAAGQAALAKGGAVRFRLAQRYIPAMSPNNVLRSDDGVRLNGDPGLSPEQAQAWSHAWAAERMSIPVAGVAECVTQRYWVEPSDVAASPAPR